MNNRGFTLTEVLIVIVLIGILSTIATLNFSSWQKKYNVEGQVKEMLADLTAIRLQAIATKQEHRIFLNPMSYTFRRYSSEADPKTIAGGREVLRKDLKYPIQKFLSSGSYSAFADTPVIINERGYTTNWMTIAVGVGIGDASLNCLSISSARVNMGRINGNSCDFQ